MYFCTRVLSEAKCGRVMRDSIFMIDIKRCYPLSFEMWQFQWWIWVITIGVHDWDYCTLTFSGHDISSRAWTVVVIYPRRCHMPRKSSCDKFHAFFYIFLFHILFPCFCTNSALILHKIPLLLLNIAQITSKSAQILHTNSISHPFFGVIAYFYVI